MPEASPDPLFNFQGSLAHCKGAAVIWQGKKVRSDTKH